MRATLWLTLRMHLARKERRAGSASQSVHSMQSYATSKGEAGDEQLEGREGRTGVLVAVLGTHCTLQLLMADLLKRTLFIHRAEKQKMNSAEILLKAQPSLARQHMSLIASVSVTGVRPIDGSPP